VPVQVATSAKSKPASQSSEPIARGGMSLVGPRLRLPRHGYVGMHRWVGFGVIADNLLNIGRAMKKQAAT